MSTSISHQSAPYTLFDFVCRKLLPSLLFILIYVLLRRRYFHPLSRFPGPFLASVTIFWRIYVLRTGKQHLHHLAAHRKYGPVFRDGPNSLIFSDPRAIESIYGHRPQGEFRKSDWYKVFADDMDGKDHNTFTALDVMQHKRLRKRIASAYNMTSIIQYEPRFDANILHWVERIKGFNGETIDFVTWAHYLTLDLISDIVYGQPLGFIKKGGDINGYRASLREGFPYLSTFGYLQPALHLMKSRLLNFLAPSPKDKSGFGHLIGFATGIVQDRTTNGDTVGRRHMVLDFLRFKNSDGTPIPFNELVGEVVSTISAGSDSTATAITCVLNHLLHDPRVLAKLLHEITDAAQNGQLTEPVVAYAETVKMPYLNAVVRESMRLIPVFPGSFGRVVGAGGYEILPGVVVPEGTECGMDSYVTHRDRTIFGEDAEVFLPERWLPLDSERAKMMDKYILSWGYGSRTCMGRHIAILEISKSVVELLRRFEIKLLRPDLPLKINNMMAMLVDDFYVQFVPRENKI